MVAHSLCTKVHTKKRTLQEGGHKSQDSMRNATTNKDE